MAVKQLVSTLKIEFGTISSRARCFSILPASPWSKFVTSFYLKSFYLKSKLMKCGDAGILGFGWGWMSRSAYQLWTRLYGSTTFLTSSWHLEDVTREYVKIGSKQNRLVKLQHDLLQCDSIPISCYFSPPLNSSHLPRSRRLERGREKESLVVPLRRTPGLRGSFLLGNVRAV